MKAQNTERAEPYNSRRVVKKLRARTAAFALLALSLPGVVTTPGQVKNDRRLARISPELRERFAERLNLYFEYKRSRKYEQLYDLLSAGYSTVTKERPNRADFVNEQRQADAEGRGLLPMKWKVDQIVKSSDDRGGEVYFVALKTSERYDKAIVEDEVQIEARLENGDWYFREYRVIR